jgi:hypothetical protein
MERRITETSETKKKGEGSSGLEKGRLSPDSGRFGKE